MRAKLCWDADPESREESNGEGRGGYPFKGDALSALVSTRMLAISASELEGMNMDVGVLFIGPMLSS